MGRSKQRGKRRRRKMTVQLSRPTLGGSFGATKRAGNGRSGWRGAKKDRAATLLLLASCLLALQCWSASMLPVASEAQSILSLESESDLESAESASQQQLFYHRLLVPPLQDGDRSQNMQQQQFQLQQLSALQQQRPEGPLTSSSSLSNNSQTGSPPLRRSLQRRHAAASPGTMQLQEAKRKLGTGSSSVASKVQSGSQAAGQVIQAVLKGRARLDCNLEPPNQDDAVSLVLWYKDKSMVPIYSLDARSAPIQEARHKPGPWLEGRSSLKIVSLQQSAKPKATLEPRNRRQTLEVAGSRRKRRQQQQYETEDIGVARGLLDRTLASLGSTWSEFVGAESGAVELPNRQRTMQNSNAMQALALKRGQQPEVGENADEEDSEQATSGGHDGSRLVAQLRIDSLSSEDNGLYTCRVDFRKARSRTQESALKIIVPAETPTIRDLSQQQQLPASVGGSPRTVFGPHNEGAKVVLECETQGGYPEPALTWWRDGRLVDDSYEIVSASDGLVIERRSGSSEGSSASSSFEDQMMQPNESSPSSSELQQQQPLVPTTDSGLSDPNKLSSQNRLIRNRLELDGLQRADLLANYSCQAWNSKLLREPPSAFAMIDMNLRPIKVQIENERQPVLADKPLELVCRAFGSRPAALISWFRGSTKLLAPSQLAQSVTDDSAPSATSSQPQVHLKETVSSSDGANVTTSTLSFVPQIEDGGQIITCRAENAFILRLALATATGAAEVAASLTTVTQMSASLEDSWKLDVHFLPRLKLALGEKLNGYIKEGHDVYFECSVKAHPVAHEVRWWFEGKELETNVSSGVILSNQSLVLQRVSRHQRGRYTCSAINSVGESHSNSVHLRVQYAPFCRDGPQSGSSRSQQLQSQPNETESGSAAAGSGIGGEQSGDALFGAISQQRFKTHYGAARLESVRVFCHVDADPADSMSFKWAFVATAPQQAGRVGSQQQAAGEPAARAANGAGSRPEFSGQQLVYLEPSSISGLEAGESPLVSVATYTPRSELDYGTLLCWAQNALGQQAEPCAYQVVPAERPDPVRNCRLLNASDTQLTVACEPGYDGGIDQSFQMEVYDSQRQELVANVTSRLMGQTGSDGLTKADWRSTYWSPSSPASSSAEDSPPSLSSPNEIFAGENSTSSSPEDQSPESEQARPASLVSGEPTSATAIGSHQQKQRHSQTGSRGSQQPYGAIIASGGGSSPPETVLMTDANLRPATDYFLSIYSTNSKGSSKPVAFTATTMKLSNAGDLTARDSRLAGDPSHLFNDVLALSWSPFLLVCAITIALFIMFTTITFAMMKYVDFSLAGSNSRELRYDSTDESGSGGGKGNRTNEKGNDGEQQQQQAKAKRARVIAVATTNNSTLSDQAHNIPLNGMRQSERASLLNGSYLKFKLQQLTGQSPIKRSTLRQSNSENFINQLDHHQQATGQTGGRSQERLKRQFHQHSCGTLPRNMSLLQQRPAAFYPAAPTAAPFGPNLAQIQLQDMDPNSPYSGGYKATASAASSEAASCNGGVVAPPPTLASLMLAGQLQAAGQQPTSGQQQQAAVEAPRVEQLVISGKQYIHQTRQNLYQQQQPRHLQLTGCLQRGNLYAPIKEGIDQQQQLLCMDYQHGRQAACGRSDEQVIDGCLAGLTSGGSQTAVAYGSLFSAGSQLTVKSENCGANDSGNSVTNVTNCQQNNCSEQLNSSNNKTSDLGSDELVGLDCDPNNMFNGDGQPAASAGGQQQTCSHVAHLTLVDGGQNLDSDGLSSGRSLTTTNGSPSSGICIATADQLLLYRNQQLNGNSANHNNQQQQQNQRACSMTNSTQAGSTSTITSEQQESCDEFGGNVVSVLTAGQLQQQQQQASDFRLLGGAKQAAAHKAAVKQASKSLFHSEQSFNPFQQPQQDYESQLEQYTVYVDEGCTQTTDCNNNLGQFYVLPAQEDERYSNKARVRLIAGQQQSSESQQQLFLACRPEVASLVQASQMGSSNALQHHHLHTDV